MKKVAVFGLGLAFEQYYELINYKYDIKVVVDSNHEKQGKLFHGKKCVSSSDLKDYEIEAVVVTPLWKQAQNDISERILDILPEVELIYIDDCFPDKFEEVDITDRCDYTDEYGNQIVIDEGVSIHRLQVVFEGAKNKVFIHKNVRVGNLLYIHCAGNDNIFEVGEGTSMVAANVDLAENGEVRIGEDGMLSWDIDFFQNANHPIFDLATGNRVNVPKNILVGDHVWIGKGVGLLAGADIGAGCVVGYRSVVSKKYPENCTLAGSPAKIIRENICWKRDATGFYSIEHL